MKTSQLYQQDNNAAYTNIFLNRVKVMMELAQKRKVHTEGTKIQPQKVPKGQSVLAENGINYEEPMNPMQIAANRQERIQREKQKNQPTGVSFSCSLLKIFTWISKIANLELLYLVLHFYQIFANLADCLPLMILI